MVVNTMAKADKIYETDNSNPEIQAVKEAIKKTKDKRKYQRYMVILYHLKGYINIEISRMVDLCQHTVGTYVNKYKENGLPGLALGHSPGAPRRLSDEQEAKLVEVISTKTPDEVGYPNKKNWTVIIIKHWVLDNFGVEYSYTGMVDVIHRLKLSYTRPTYTLAKADPHKQEEFKQKFELLKKPS